MDFNLYVDVIFSNVGTKPDSHFGWNKTDGGVWLEHTNLTAVYTYPLFEFQVFH